MMKDEKTYHLINDYLLGNLQGRALDEFKTRLKEDEDFAAQVEQQKHIIKAIQDAREQELRNYMKEHAQVKYFGNSWGNKWTYASAAIIVLFISLFFIVKNYGPEQNEVVQERVSDTPEYKAPPAEDSFTRVDSQTVVINDAPPPPPEIEVVEDEDEINDEVLKDESNDVTEPIENVEEDFAEYGDEVIRTPAPESTTSRSSSDGDGARDDYDVKRDELLSSTVYTVYHYSTQKDTGTKRLEYGTDNPVYSGTGSNRVKSSSLTVEFWKSPVNFTGYMYNNSKLQLYGIDKNQNISFKQLDQRLYMKVGKKLYYLNPNGTYNKLIEVTNDKLLELLNE